MTINRISYTNLPFFKSFRNEEGDKELEKERERIMPFITFQQVTTSSTSTNGLSSVEGTDSITTDSEDGITLPPIESKVSPNLIENAQNGTKSQPSSPSLLTNVVNASIDMALLPGSLGLGNSRKRKSYDYAKV